MKPKLKPFLNDYFSSSPVANLLGCTPKCFLKTVLKYFVLIKPVASATSVTDKPFCNIPAALSRRNNRINSCGVLPVSDFNRPYNRVRLIAISRHKESMLKSVSVIWAITVSVAFRQIRDHCPTLSYLHQPAFHRQSQAHASQ